MTTNGNSAAPDEVASLATFQVGRAILGRAQFLPGYSLLLCQAPEADRLTDLPRSQRLTFLAELETVGEAVEIVCGRRDPAFRRINLEILGNLTPKLHAHIWPRYEWEPHDLRIRQVGRYPLEQWHRPETQLGQQHVPLRDALRAELDRLVTESDR